MRLTVLFRRIALCVRAPLLSLLALLTLQSCSMIAKVPGGDRLAGEDGVFRDRKGDYLEAETIARTEIPEGLDGYIIDDLLVIPAVPAAADQTFLDPPRPRAIEGRSDREVVIQSMQGRSWIIVDVSPSQVWPRIRDYWVSQGVEIAAENPTAGIMQTGWFVRSGNVISRDRVRVTVETGFQNNSSEIRILQMSQPQATPPLDVSWPAASQESEVESQLVTELAGYLADVADLYTASSVSFLAGNISSEGKAALQTRADGSEVLLLQSSYERAWAAVSRALLRANVLIDEQDSATGLIDVHYLPGMGEEQAEDEPGFFGRLFSFGDDLPEPEPLQVRVRQGDAGVEVDISPASGASAQGGGETPASRLLQLIRNTIA
ncbi:MAG: outer membrane protein assembly factor BamC [Pseudomonadales bacterium]|jgi:outer membrane protein assembly factor BamC|nr:outer membrane protein assembly factor BamC [Pseudomonadales bacterium]